MMKKLLLLLCFAPFLGQSQVVYSFGFNGTTAAMLTAGWEVTNQSSPVYTGAPTWSIPATAPTTTFAGGGQAGGGTSFALINYTSTGTSSTAGTGTISNWLISPAVDVQNGDVVSFYTRIGRNAAALYADRLQLRMSTAGAFTSLPSGGATGLGDFTNLLVDVNPDYDLTSYPTAWGQYTYTVTGLSGLTNVRFAFRYFVEDGGPGGANSDIIGLDTFLVDRPAANTQDFFTGNFSIQPNPVSDVFTLNTKNGVAIEKVEVLDINGRIVSQVNGSSTEALQVNVSDLNSGVYFVRVQSDLGVGTSKIIKK
ncbi:T9SS-dependent choice-of-anchor J family protein [Flavobacterium chungnamense]|uniref:Secretion system C-terminal sorting domain-containing protein n=1 Tax=Flavobacterium chungnamense TaxID=706182 RepID=A0ABP7UIS1_9FLAO